MKKSSLSAAATSVKTNIRHDGNAVTTIRAMLLGSTTCVAPALGLASTGNTPVIELCRLLIEHGHNPRACMLVYRGATLALRIPSIGTAAQLEISGKSTFFIRRPGVRAASPVRKSASADPQVRASKKFAAVRAARPGR
jgi:hypothetical protein